MKLTDRERRIFNALAARILPGEPYDYAPAIERYFAGVDRTILKNIKRALFVFDRGAHVSRLTHRSFTKLGAAEQDKYIRAWASSRFYPRRALFTALKTVVTLIYASRPDVEKAAGYSPTGLL